MKRILMNTLKLAGLLPVLFLSFNVLGQEAVEEDISATLQVQEDPCSKYGPDSTKTLDEASIYTEFYKQKNYEAAMPHWRYVYHNAPGYHEAVVVNGFTLYKYLIDNETDSLRKERYIDTLLSLYDKRIECYGKACFNLGRKGYDLMKYRPRNYDDIRNTYQAALDECDLSPEYFILYPYTKLMAYEYRKGNLDTAQMLAVYEQIAKIVDYNKDGQYGDKYLSTFESVEKELKSIGVLTCETLRDYYASVYLASPDDPATWEKVNLALSSCNTCDTTFLEMKKKLFQVAPDAELATDIADCEKNIGSPAAALAFLDEAIALDTNTEQQAKLAYNSARILYDLGRYSEARAKAYEALKYKPNWGDPYLLIGTMYISSGAICKDENPFYGFAVSLVAVDKFIQARQADPEVAEEANRLIAKYSDFFPTTEAVFERNMSEGDPYTVKCWINESTTIRTKK